MWNTAAVLAGGARVLKVKCYARELMPNKLFATKTAEVCCDRLILAHILVMSPACYGAI